MMMLYADLILSLHWKAATLPSTAKTEEFMDTFSRTINGEKISDLQPDLFTGGRLRKYQVEGIEWLKVRHNLFCLKSFSKTPVKKGIKNDCIFTSTISATITCCFCSVCL